MTTQIINELRNANIRIEENMITKIKEAIFFVNENGADWFNENSTFGSKLKVIVLKFVK